jgi:hypothetical protein
MQTSMARLTLARKMAAITLILWKKEARFERRISETASSLGVSTGDLENADG